MPLFLASAHLSDHEFLDAFHSCRLPTSEFHHADHLRLAWLHLHGADPETALSQVRTGIRNFAAHHGLDKLYHETITTAWVRLLATHAENSFEDFLARNQDRIGKDLLHHYWTPERLNSPEARTSWVPPDRRELPTSARA